MGGAVMLGPADRQTYSILFYRNSHTMNNLSGNLESHNWPWVETEGACVLAEVRKHVLRVEELHLRLKNKFLDVR